MIVFLLSSVAFAQHSYPPTCYQGQIYYQNQQHTLIDFCIEFLKAKTPKECEKKVNEFKAQENGAKIAMDFFKKRREEVCGK